MKILHLCLASFYIDNYSYQENLLPKYHKKLGFDVEIIASLVTFDSTGELSLHKTSGTYYNEYGIKVTRLKYDNIPFGKVLRKYKGTYDSIEEAKPNIIFVHGVQFIDIKQVRKYVQNNKNVKVYVDNHADFSNSARNFLSREILHKLIWKHYAKSIEPVTNKFWGVLPARVDFLIDIYKLPKNKVELLVMGADDDEVVKAKEHRNIDEIKKRHNIKDEDFIIVTGGKIDSAKKQVITLLEVIKKLDIANIKLVFFGSITDELKEKITSFVNNKNIIYVGWLSTSESYQYFSIANLVIFPGRHSVYWEQVVGLGKPIMVKYWDGTTHIDLGGNCEFLHDDSHSELECKILRFYNNPKLLKKMKYVSETKGMESFSYKRISEKSIGLRE